MKKILVCLLAVFMTVSIVGTVGAVDNTWTLSNTGTVAGAEGLKFFASPVTDSGASVYLLAGGPVQFTANPTTTSGASLMIINPTTGVSVFYGNQRLRRPQPTRRGSACQPF